MAGVIAQDDSQVEQQVREWRAEVLGGLRDRNGDRFTDEQVNVLAGGRCDLHAAAELIKSGCLVLTAFDILS